MKKRPDVEQKHEDKADELLSNETSREEIKAIFARSVADTSIRNALQEFGRSIINGTLEAHTNEPILDEAQDVPATFSVQSKEVIATTDSPAPATTKEQIVAAITQSAEAIQAIVRAYLNTISIGTRKSPLAEGKLVGANFHKGNMYEQIVRTLFSLPFVLLELDIRLIKFLVKVELFLITLIPMLLYNLVIAFENDANKKHNENYEGGFTKKPYTLLVNPLAGDGASVSEIERKQRKSTTSSTFGLLTHPGEWLAQRAYQNGLPTRLGMFDDIAPHELIGNGIITNPAIRRLRLSIARLHPTDFRVLINAIRKWTNPTDISNAPVIEGALAHRLSDQYPRSRKQANAQYAIVRALPILADAMVTRNKKLAQAQHFLERYPEVATLARMNSRLANPEDWKLKVGHPTYIGRELSLDEFLIAMKDITIQHSPFSREVDELLAVNGVIDSEKITHVRAAIYDDKEDPLQVIAGDGDRQIEARDHAQHYRSAPPLEQIRMKRRDWDG